MKTVTYTVPNISCQHCLHTIETELGEMRGVASVHAEQESKRVEIAYDDPATTDGIESLLAEINYPVAK
jgi:copper chaperone CopZ